MRRLLMLTAALGFLASPVLAHCDSMDGPVVQDAQHALETQDVTPTLKWVTAKDEDKIRSAFDMTLAVRDESNAAKALADRYFFETLVRVHRASEGEAFTGLKPTGSVEPAIAAADQALDDGNVAPLADELASAIRHGVEERFAVAYEKRQTAEDTVEQGRAYVDAYVQFTHFANETDHLAEAGAAH
ncbi:DUF6448 family protein [Hoeflea sp.]|uniref:DUF6448 family protein n=1 Tax=Hoeflea sp. TaxID=1940281 RepID=UPI0019B3D85D|nr:DUF6448 family protein [Hoeflea sp.]MBC7285406.1 hypothetical protein [Hoeflea sp.]